MSFSKLLEKIFKNSGAGPSLSDDVTTELVHKTGEEIISGYKGFTDIYVAKRLDDVTRGTIPSTTQYSDWAFDDVDGHLLGCVELACRDASNTEYANSRIDLKMWCKPVDADPGSTGAALAVGWDDQGRRFAVCPSTSNNRTYGNDILTRDWIPKDTRIVHTSGSESISGVKTWYSNQYYKNTTHARNTSSNDNFNLTWTDMNDNITGMIQHYFSSAEVFTQFRTHLVDSDTDYQVGLRHQAGGNIYFGPRGTGSSGTINLGQAGNYWKEVYAYASAINTSDKRLKTEISGLNDDVLDVWGSVEWKQFKMKDSVKSKGDSARMHVGLIAQDVDNIFKTGNLNAADYGFFCWDEWKSEDDEDKGTMKDLYALRYTEALCLEAAYMRRKVSRLESRIAELEKANSAAA